MLEMNKSLDKPRMFNIRTFPIKERDLFFHTETQLSSLESLGSTFTDPEKMPRILVFFTHERPSGSSGLTFQAPSHKASVLALFNLAPDPFSKRASRDFSFLTKAVVSSAYFELQTPGSWEEKIFDLWRSSSFAS